LKPPGIALALLHFPANLLFLYARFNEFRHAQLAGALSDFFLLHDADVVHEHGGP